MTSESSRGRIVSAAAWSAAMRSFLLATLLFACGGQTLDVTGGSTSEQIKGMPPLPFALASTGPAFRRAWRATKARYPLSAPPAWATEDAFRGWIHSDYTPWISAHGDALAYARLAAAEPDATDQERGVMHAVVAFVANDIASSIESMNLPARVEKSQSFEAIVRELEAPIPKLRSHAESALHACATDAGPTELAAWVAHCRKQLRLAETTEPKRQAASLSKPERAKPTPNADAPKPPLRLANPDEPATP